MKIELKPIGRRSGGTVSWDPETGEIWGPQSEEVRELIERAVRRGGVVTHPYPTFYEVDDPWHNVRDFALVVSQFWKVPAILREEVAV
ncbi:MAG: hypothetical protein KDC35_07995 [Acidobacteria bacterium]|nr:hypothetical protein [Acidobacteriota bacterium]